MKKTKFLHVLLGIALGETFMFSCASEDIKDVKGNSEAMIVAVSNEQKVDFNIEYDVPQGYKVVFDVYAENPFEVTSEGFGMKEGLSPIISAMTDEDGVYNISRVVSGGVKETYVVARSAGVPALLHGSIVNGVVEPVEVDLNSLIDEPEEVESRASFNVQYLGSWNYWGRPNYIDNSMKCQISLGEMRAINKALPEWRKVKDEYTTADFVLVEKETELWVSLLSEKSLFNNALGYYCYTDGMSKDDVKEVIALPRTNISWLKNVGLKSGEYVKLKYLNPVTNKLEDKFPAGTRVGWVLHRSGFHCLSSKVSNGTYQFYSNNVWNPETSKKNHTAMFTTSKGNVIVGFEDTYNEALLVDNDCNDVVFHVASSLPNAISTAVEVPDVSDDVVEEEVDVVQPLSGIIEVSSNDALANDILVASKSHLMVEDGYVVGVKDILYLAKSETMNGLVTRTYSTDEMERKVVVRTTVKFARSGEEEKKGRTVVRTTVKCTTWEVEEENSRSVFDYAGDDIAGLITAAVDHYRQKLSDGACIRLEVVMEFEPVEYEEFVTNINLPPYSPFIEHVAE